MLPKHSISEILQYCFLGVVRQYVIVVDSQDEHGTRPFEEVFYPAERVPFVEWREFSGAKPTVALVAAVAVLAFVTGLSNLSRAQPVVEGPLATLIPAAPILVRFVGVLLAFPLGIATVGLGRRKRLAWLGAMVLVPALAILPLTTGRTTEIPLLVLVLLTVPLLVANREEFDQPLGLSSLQIASLASILGVGLYGTVGAYGLRRQFLELEGWGDAIYYVIVTIATVGYGDITPTTLEAKLFSLSVILLGTGAFTVAVGALIGPAIESRMAAAFGTMTASELSLLEDHVVVLGYGDVAESFLDRVGDGTDLVVVTDDAEAASRLTDAGFEVLTDDPTDEAVLADARVDAARGVAVAGDDDAENVLAVLAARDVSPDIRIVAVANKETHAKKLDAVGADEVIDLRSIGGRLLGASILDGDAPDVDPAAVLGFAEQEADPTAEDQRTTDSETGEDSDADTDDPESQQSNTDAR
ncbi:voltage-gated potassium channel [Halobellus clavatus]|uniref:Voltage-gated potassium channel n=1 Tax=Halobellus clavatus TaxID=660517 RepID=A0A1H3FRF8_9EURY|nr:voltage-gated potassium channel [Halobellus clavatus]